MRSIFRGGDRFSTRAEGRDTRHSFSFGHHYDPANVGFAQLVAHNDDRLAPRAGYPEHAHRDVEIVTVVISGSLIHRDTDGGFATLTAGAAQVQSAGTGIVHSEFADAEGCRFIQTWVRPDESGLTPRRVVAAPEPRDTTRQLVGPDGALPLACQGARLWLARLDIGESFTLAPAAYHQVFVAEGAVNLDPLGQDSLASDDALRLVDDGAELQARAPSTLLAWSFD